MIKKECTYFFFIIIQVCQSQISLVDFNKNFLREVTETRSRFLTTIDPLFISSGPNLTLIYHGERTSVRIVSKLFRDLKVFSHIPLTIYLMLFNIQSKDCDLSSNQIEIEDPSLTTYFYLYN